MVDSENLCRRAMEIYGFPAQAAMVVEECSELTNAICKFRRGRVGMPFLCRRIIKKGKSGFMYKNKFYSLETKYGWVF